jgi:hypothetical protein
MFSKSQQLNQQQMGERILRRQLRHGGLMKPEPGPWLYQLKWI